VITKSPVHLFGFINMQLI